MTGTIRKAVTLFDEFDGTTYLKPFSGEYDNQLIVINEDAYGEYEVKMVPIPELKKNFAGTDKEFDMILKQLNL